MSRTPTPEAAPWHPRGRPHLWIPKHALDTLTHHCEAEEAASLLAVYLGFVRAADDCNCTRFQKPVSCVAAFAFCSARKVLRYLPRLETLGLIAVERRTIPGSKEHDLSVYEVILPPKAAPRDVVTECHDVATECHEVVTSNSNLRVTVSRDKRDSERPSNSTSSSIPTPSQRRSPRRIIPSI